MSETEREMLVGLMSFKNPDYNSYDFNLQGSFARGVQLNPVGHI